MGKLKWAHTNCVDLRRIARCHGLYVPWSFWQFLLFFSPRQNLPQPRHLKSSTCTLHKKVREELLLRLQHTCSDRQARKFVARSSLDSPSLMILTRRQGAQAFSKQNVHTAHLVTTVNFNQQYPQHVAKLANIDKKKRAKQSAWLDPPTTTSTCGCGIQDTCQ